MEQMEQTNKIIYLTVEQAWNMHGTNGTNHGTSQPFVGWDV